MPSLQGLRRLAVLAALFAFVATLTGPMNAVAQDEAAACSNQIDDDSDGAVDGFDPGCGGGSDDDETDSPYSGILVKTVPLPVVTLQGTVDAKGNVKVSRLQIRAQSGSTAEVECRGKSCPFRRSSSRMLRTSLRLTALERKLKAPLTLTLRIRRASQLGKFVQYKLRRNQAPVRTDDCLNQDSGKRQPCFVD
jgi:hypothetical protein